MFIDSRQLLEVTCRLKKFGFAARARLRKTNNGTRARRPMHALSSCMAIATTPAHGWAMAERTPTRLQFDVSRYRRLPCDGISKQEKAVCVIDKKVAHGVVWHMASTNIGHQAQFIFKCWSFFQEHPHATRVVVDNINHRMGFLNNSWGARMLAALEVRFEPRVPSRCAAVWGVPTSAGIPGLGESWFPSVRAAWALTAQVMRVDMSDAGLLPGELVPSSGVHVGVLRRAAPHEHRQTANERGRDWTAHTSFIASLQRRPVPGVASASSFTLGKHHTLQQQAELIRRSEIIITPHGSQSVSLAFIRPCTVLVEVLAGAYVVTLFSDLAINAGGRAIMLVHDAATVPQAALNTLRTFQGSSRKLLRQRNAGGFDTLDVQTVREAVVKALKVRERCMAGDDDVPFDGVPSLGGFSDAASWLNETLRSASGHCFHCTPQDAACCASPEALTAYYHTGAYACAHCMATFKSQSLPDDCQQGRCRLPNLLGAKAPTSSAPPGALAPQRSRRLFETRHAARAFRAAAVPADVTLANFESNLAFYARAYPAKRTSWRACNASTVAERLSVAARLSPGNATAHASAFLASCSLDMKRFSSFDAMGFFSATWLPEVRACTRLVRFGPAVGAEGGKTLCLDNEAMHPDKPCFVMSVGLNGDTRFEEALHAYAPHCKIVGMDGTLNDAKLGLSKNLPYLTFVAENFKRGTVARYAGRTVQLLKIDCESCEYTTIAPWLDTTCTEQVAVEVHKSFLRRPIQRVLSQHNLFSKLDQTHRLVFVEANRKWPQSAVEYTWVRRVPC